MRTLARWLAIAPMVVLAAAGRPASRCSTETGWQTCDPRHTPVPTRTVTSTVTVTQTGYPRVARTTVTSGRSTTTTVTQTASTTVIVTPTATATASVTTTGTITTTATVTVSSYLTTVTSSNTDTVTVQPSPSFVPVASDISASGGTPTTSGPMQRRTAAPRASPWHKKGPVKVVCTAYKTVTITTYPNAATTMTVTVTGPVRTQSLTATTTVSITNTASAVTITSTQTATATNTATTTETDSFVGAVTTVLGPAPTYYAACAANNLVNYINGYNVGGFRDSNYIPLPIVSTPYDCCVECLTNPSCGAGYALSSNGEYVCTGFSFANTCNASQNVATVHAEQQSGAGGENWVFNSNCGQWAYGGVE